MDLGAIILIFIVDFEVDVYIDVDFDIVVDVDVQGARGQRRTDGPDDKI